MSEPQARQIRDFLMKIANPVVSAVFKLLIVAVTEKVPGESPLKQIRTTFEDMTSQCDRSLCD